MTTSVEYKKQIEELTIKMNEAKEAEQKEANKACSELGSRIYPMLFEFSKSLPEGHKLITSELTFLENGQIFVKCTYQDGTGNQFEIC